MKKNILSIIILLLSANILFAQEGTLKIVVSGIESNKGVIYAALYDEAGKLGFLKDIESAHKKKIVKINNKQVALTFTNIPYGNYAVSIFQDENNNGEIDRTKIGFPAEPWGISGNKFVIGPPKFQDGKFKINSATKTIKINMRSFL